MLQSLLLFFSSLPNLIVKRDVDILTSYILRPGTGAVAATTILLLYRPKRLSKGGICKKEGPPEAIMFFGNNQGSWWFSVQSNWQTLVTGLHAKHDNEELNQQMLSKKTNRSVNFRIPTPLVDLSLKLFTVVGLRRREMALASSFRGVGLSSLCFSGLKGWIR
jgi:hypothetical protein